MHFFRWMVLFTFWFLSSINDFKFKPSDRETSFGTASDVKQFKVYFDGEEKNKFETYFGTVFSQLQAKSRYNLSLSCFPDFLLMICKLHDISGEY